MLVIWKKLNFFYTDATHASLSWESSLWGVYETKYSRMNQGNNMEYSL